MSEQQRAAIQQARDWIAERPEDRTVSAGKMVAILTAALAAPQPDTERAKELLDAFDGAPFVQAQGCLSGVSAPQRQPLTDEQAIAVILNTPNDLGTADVWHEGTQSFYRATLLQRLTPEEAMGDVTETAPQPTTLKLSSDGAAVVNPDTFWIPITKENMPIEGARYLLINRSAGMTQVAPFKNDGWWTHFAGMPKFKD